MKQEQFNKLSQQGYNRIPLSLELLADLETPLTTYLKLADQAYSFLFESVQGGEKWSRYSIIGLPCRTIIRVYGYTVTIENDNKIISETKVDDPLAWVEQYIQQYKVPELANLPSFHGGLVGYFGYDAVRYVEPRLRDCPSPDPLGNPDILLMLTDDVLVFDNVKKKIHVIGFADPAHENAFDTTQQRLQSLKDKLHSAQINYPKNKTKENKTELTIESNFTQAEFESAIERVKQYIVDGDVMQVVLSQRLSTPYHGNPLDMYRALRSLNPSPYMYYLNLNDFHIVGASPEILVRAEDNIITVRPLAGTRKRGETEEQDLALERELLADEKEIAEHLMLIDLGRNDVGRVSEIGSVEVTDKMDVERYSHVMHIVSQVHGRLKKGCSAIDALRATLPAGTLSGAPKIRAMEIIDELENLKRGIYGGAVGYLAWNGNMDTAIAIRTAVIKDNKIHIQAGAGLVHDSVPHKEWEETMNKANAVIRALEIVENEM